MHLSSCSTRRWPRRIRAALLGCCLSVLVIPAGCVSRVQQRDPDFRDAMGGGKATEGRVSRRRLIWFWEKEFYQPSR
jgi:hypothetical protein